jgi:hypothetical protein
MSVRICLGTSVTGKDCKDVKTVKTVNKNWDVVDEINLNMLCNQKKL